MMEPQLVMAAVRSPDGSTESEAVFVVDDGRTLQLELPDGSFLEIDDLELAQARGSVGA